MISPISSPNLVKALLRRAAAVILLASMLAVVAAGAACSKETKGFAGLMQSMPYGTSHFSYWDIGAMDSDEDLWEIYDRFKQSPDAEQLSEFVPVLATIKESAKVVSYDNTTLVNPVVLFRGGFDMTSTEGILETLNYSKISYQKVGIWTREDNQTIFDSAAIKSGTVLMGDVSDLRSCINVIVQKDTRSLYKDPNIRLVTDRLPNGLVVEVARVDASHGEQYADLVAYGKSYTKVKKDMLKLTAVYLFGDGPAANAAQQPVGDYLAASFAEVKVKRDGNVVIATCQISISKFAQNLEF